MKLTETDVFGVFFDEEAKTYFAEVRYSIEPEWDENSDQPQPLPLGVSTNVAVGGEVSDTFSAVREKALAAAKAQLKLVLDQVR